MSHTVQVCLKYDGPLYALKGDIERVLGIHLTHFESGSPTLRAFYGRLMTIDVELSTNPFETDGNLNFSDYQYVLSTRVAGHACAEQLRKLQVPLTDVIGILLNHYLGVEVMVTIEMQELLARYQTTGESNQR